MSEDKEESGTVSVVTMRRRRAWRHCQGGGGCRGERGQRGGHGGEEEGAEASSDKDLIVLHNLIII